MKTIFLITFILLTLFSLGPFLSKDTTSEPALNTSIFNPLPSEPEAPIEVGKLIMVGHWAHTPVASTTSLVRDINAGGVVIMSAPENPEEIKGWIDEWNGVSDTPLLIAIDQEGGPVTRIKSTDFTLTAQSEITTEEGAYAVGLKRGQELAALGINLNFAPVLDKAVNPDSFMFSRTFPHENNPAALAASMSKGLSDGGVISVAKHFPGHDDTEVDSHLALPEVNITRAELDSFTTQFRTYIEQSGPKALMTAHVSFPKIDPLPATLSKFFLTDYLRDELNFNGIVITDDMSMDAIDTIWTTDEAAVLSITAGADMVLFAAEPEQARGGEKALQAALDAGTLDMEKARKSILSITSLLK